MVTIAFQIKVRLHILYMLGQCGSLMHNDSLGWFSTCCCAQVYTIYKCWYHALVVCHPHVIFVKEKVVERLEGELGSHVVYMQMRRWKKVFSPKKKPAEK